MTTEVYQKALESAKARGDKRQEAQAYLALGDALKFCDKFEAIHSYEKAYEIAKDRNDKEQKSKSFLGLGSVYKLLNQFEKAIDYYEKVLKIANEQKDEQLQTEVYIGLGDALQLDNQISKAIDSFKKALQIAQERSDDMRETEAHIWLGNIYKLNNQIELAIVNYEKSLQIALKRQDKRQETEAYFGLGHAYNINKNTALAIENFEKALKISKEREDKRVTTEAYFGLADSYRQSNQIQAATKNYEKALSLARERQDRRQETDAYLWLGHLRKFSSETEPAIEMYEKPLELAKKQNDKRQQAEALLGIADVRKVSENQENPPRQLPTPTGRDPGSCYPMKRPYGFALVVNINRFENRAAKDDNKTLKERKGSDVDVKNLKDLWEQLGFQVKIYEDLKAHEIYTVVQKMARKIDGQKTSSCFVCCIMTHGDMGMIYGSDSKSLSINIIIDQFKEENCQALAAKPKLFFIQACRGIKDLIASTQDPKAAVSTSAATPLTGSTEEGTKEGSNARETESVSIVEAECDVESDKNDSAFRHSAEPNEHHFLLGYSTAPGSVSLRDTRNGTWYVTALVETFRRYHRDEDVMSMMTRVNYRVSKAYTESGYKQCPTPIFTLTKKIFLDDY